jgi:hypothetical protein
MVSSPRLFVEGFSSDPSSIRLALRCKAKGAAEPGPDDDKTGGDEA